MKYCEEKSDMNTTKKLKKEIFKYITVKRNKNNDGE